MQQIYKHHIVIVLFVDYSYYMMQGILSLVTVTVHIFGPIFMYVLFVSPSLSVGNQISIYTRSVICLSGFCI